MKYTIHAVDPSGTPWDICQTDHGDSALDTLDSLRAHKPRGKSVVYWVTLTDDPEYGDCEGDLYLKEVTS